MKRILFFMMLLFAGSKTVVSAKTFNQNDNGEIILTASDEREIKGQPTQISPEDRPITRGVIFQIAYAYIYNKVVSIDFNTAIESATVTITNIATGETVHAETYSDPTTLNIDLNGENSGSCLIEIEANGTLLTGEFSL